MASDFDKIFAIAMAKAKGHGDEYVDRLEKERSEIEKQGAEQYWIDLLKSGTTFSTNKNGLVLPFVLRITDVDPIKDKVPHLIKRDPDMPDIDLDFLPEAREVIKSYARKRFGEDKVCSVGSWTTYNPKSAHQDVARAKGQSVDPVIKLTTQLPDDFDSTEDPQKACEEFADYKKFYDVHKDICDPAFKLVGKIKTQGRHAGGLIISSVPLWDHLPMAKMKDHWTSEWTEGMRSVQLSKFGFVKYDILGLKTMRYIWLAERYIKEVHGVEIDWKEIGYANEKALNLANSLHTDSIFQFDTDSMKSIISKGGVKSFNDLLIYNAMGRPGPMPMIDEYVHRRDDPGQTWRTEEHPRIVEMFEDTLAVCVFQEQLTQYWTDICGFTVPEAEKARKIIAKKWVDQLPAIKAKAFEGAKRVLGEKWAKTWNDRIETFGRYAFNRAHAVAYCIQSYRCLYLKAHYPTEWWCAVLNTCDSNKLAKYMGIARVEGTKFGLIDVNNLSADFAVVGDRITPGLLGIKSIGPSIIEKIKLGEQHYRSIDDFVEQNIKNKTLIERLIKLGAFDKLHSNRNSLWYWYQFKYGSGTEATQIKKAIRKKFEWDEADVLAERKSREEEYFKLYPKRKKVPNKISNWKPKIEPTREEVMGIIENDFTIDERLGFQKQYLGYYWDSPMDMFKHHGKTIASAKVNRELECVIETIEHRKTKTGKNFITLHLTDGVEKAKIQIWDPDSFDMGFAEGDGIYAIVDWDDRYSSFSISTYGDIKKLRRIDDDSEDPNYKTFEEIEKELEDFRDDFEDY